MILLLPRSSCVQWTKRTKSVNLLRMVSCQHATKLPLLVRRCVSSVSSSTVAGPTSTSRDPSLVANKKNPWSINNNNSNRKERHWSSAAAVQLDDFSDEEYDDDDVDDDRSSEPNAHLRRRKRNSNSSSSSITTFHSTTTNDPKHCTTCTCPEDQYHYHNNAAHLRHFENPLVQYPFHQQSHQKQSPESMHSESLQKSGMQVQEYINRDKEQEDDYPPPLPEPKVTFRRRVLPEHLVALSSPEGQQALMRAMVQQTAATYFMLTQHWDNQSDPASCGVTTLRQVLNAAGMDPTAVRWKGGWRYYGSDSMVVCRCMDPVRIQRAGITLSEFVRLAHCHGLEGRSERPGAARTHNDKDEAGCINTVKDFRNDVLQSLTTTTTPAQSDDPEKVVPPTFLVVSFSRAVLQQTGDGHFSTVAAYDAETDSCLVLDVARFKYPPYWVSVDELFESMRPIDPVTKESRGWSLWQRAGPWPTFLSATDGNVTDEGALPAAWVPAFDETNDATCPLRPIQVQYCPSAWARRKQDAAKAAQKS